MRPPLAQLKTGSCLMCGRGSRAGRVRSGPLASLGGTARPGALTWPAPRQQACSCRPSRGAHSWASAAGRGEGLTSQESWLETWLQRGPRNANQARRGGETRKGAFPTTHVKVRHAKAAQQSREQGEGIVRGAGSGMQPAVMRTAAEGASLTHALWRPRHKPSQSQGEARH